jgi:DNA-binding MarR family transcriptional regulator
MRIEDEIKINAFSNDFHRAHVNILFTGAWAHLRMIQWLKPFNLSPQQFNVLRILRGRHPQPASIKELTERMLDKTSNASRVVDKLVKKKWVCKNFSPDDQRQAKVTITKEGLVVLENASRILEAQTSNLFSHFTAEEASQISLLLDKLRS